MVFKLKSFRKVNYQKKGKQEKSEHFLTRKSFNEKNNKNIIVKPIESLLHSGYKIGIMFIRNVKIIIQNNCRHIHIIQKKFNFCHMFAHQSSYHSQPKSCCSEAFMYFF